MKILLYSDLDTSVINGFKKLCQHIENNDFQSADVKKIGENLYRAKLNRTDRLLFSIYQFNGEAYALFLEYIENHQYDKSRFLRRGVKIEESRIPTISLESDLSPEVLPFLNTRSKRINLLDKPISFDDSQSSILEQTLPLIIIGSAGSGKTSLILEKIKKMKGDVLYVSHSPFLVQTSKDLYQSYLYSNDKQQLHFLSFEELIGSVKIPEGRPVDSTIFQRWFLSHIQNSPIKDGYKLFEEFRGVISGSINKDDSSHKESFLSREEYLSLGVKQAIFLLEDRNSVYDLFLRYLNFLAENSYYDINLICHHYLPNIFSRYDAVVIDEVQDFTNIQLEFIFKMLHKPHNFLLCGDANQAVHPNFFSWAKIKPLFARAMQHNSTVINVLRGNYRNSARITHIANNILKLKTLRFGSIDKESHYLMIPNKKKVGSVLLFRNETKVTSELNLKTHNATNYAVLVASDIDKQTARKLFDTPLVFTIQEAKGLEYENIILFNLINSNATQYHQICQGITPQQLRQDIKYSRNKNKKDKSAETYKFYINALYVALTRAITNIYWLETNPKHSIFNLLGLGEVQNKLSLQEKKSSLREWQLELTKLEQQGKHQQADTIRENILQQQKPKWPVYDTNTIQELEHEALINQKRKAKLALFEYALVYDDHFYRNALIKVGFKPASNPEKGLTLLHKKYFMNYQSKNLSSIEQLTHRYGVNFRNTFNQTPLMIATQYGNTKLIDLLINKNADKSLCNNKGHNAFQIALYLAWKDIKYANNKLAAVFFALSPDSLHLRIDNKHIKLDKNSCEFFIINLMMALFYEILPQKMIFTGGGFTPHDIVEALKHFPKSLLTSKLYDPHFVGGILSTHKMHDDTPQSLKLFYRVMPEHYLINPKISIKINEKWVNIYDLLSFDQLSLAHKERLGMIDTDAFYSNVLADLKIQYKTALGIK